MWVLECAEEGSVSQTRRLNCVVEEMREAIAYQAGLSVDDVDIIVEMLPKVPQPTECSDAYDRFDELARNTTEGASELMKRLEDYDRE